MPQTILEMTKNIEKDASRIALFPAMDYRGLYNALILLIEDAVLIHSGLKGFISFYLILHKYHKI